MIVNLLKTILRSILRHKGIFAVKVLSFVVAFLFSVFVLEWIHFESNYDRWTDDYQQIYRISFKWVKPGERESEFAFINSSWIKEIPGFFPEVEQMVRLEQQHGNIAIKANERKFNTRYLFGADSNVFEVFNVDFLQGNKENILDKPKSVAISKSLAERCFGGAECVGKTIGCSQTWDSTYIKYNIVGVFNDFPKQSHFHPELIVSFTNPEIYQRRNYVYLKLKKNASLENILAKFEEFQQHHVPNEKGYKVSFSLQPISDIHLESNKARELETPGNPTVMKMLSIAVLALLLIVMINYSNLQIGQYLKDQKLLFIHQSLGSKKRINFYFLLLNSFLIVTISLLLALGFYKWVFNMLSNYLGIEPEIDIKHTITSFAMLYAIIVVFIVLISLYIVFILGQKYMRPMKIHNVKDFQNNIVPDSKTRSILLIIQAAATICILITTIIAVMQLRYLTMNRLGSGMDNVLVMKNIPRVAVGKYLMFKEELLKKSGILDVTSAMEEPSGQTNDRGAIRIDGKEEDEKRLFILPVDYNFNKFYNNPLIAGEDLSYVSERNASEKYIINETAMHYLGYTNPKDILGKTFEYLLPYDGFFYPGYISGVVKDFHLSSMEEETKPLILYYLTFFSYSISIKFNPENIPGAVDALTETWQGMFPDYPLEYYFIDQLYNKVYAQYIVQSKFLKIILIIILILSNTGLLAMVTLQINRRIKEIGIRKVNGAKTWYILIMMNRSVVLLILVGMLFAYPIAWYTANKWMNNFAYRIDIYWWVFLLSGCVAMFTALLTVSFKTWYVASKNPVEALRYE
jgi:putative ABC transport system permease protein